MENVTKVTRNFQVTIPEEVRNEMRIRIGDEVVFERADFGFRVHKLEKAKIEDFIGAFGKFDENITSTELQRKWRREFAAKREKKLGLS